MKTNLDVLTVFIIVVVLLGFVGLSLYFCVASIITEGDVEIQVTVIYVANAIAGVVGAIAASALGVEIPDSSSRTEKRKRKMANLGNLVLTGSLHKKEKEININAANLGKAYAWGYAIVGLICIAVWMIDDAPAEIVKNTASITLPIFLAVVKNLGD